jgi:hypothetical protein
VSLAKRFVVAVLLTAAVAVVPSAGARQEGSFPTRALFIAGTSLAGVKLGDTQAAVKARLGPRYEIFDQSKDVIWLYEYQGGEPLGMGIRFDKKLKVVAMFTLGTPIGWKTDKGLKLFDPISNVYQYYNTTKETRCIGYDALSMGGKGSTSAFYSAAGVVYGFALVVPGQNVCQ